MPALAKQNSVRSLIPPVLLPDQREFLTWESPNAPVFIKDIYVDCANPSAGDDNPGTADRPFKTINGAAQIAAAGDRVVIHSGTYRERVAPARGGDSPERMIHYAAALGAEVIVSGSNIITPSWLLSDTYAQEGIDVWLFDIDSSWFDDGYNPFDIENVTSAQFASMDWTHPERNNPLFSLPRGLVFQDGVRLVQVNSVDDLGSTTAAYWVDRKSQQVHVRPINGINPNDATFEVTARETVFAPYVENLGYIHVSGLIVEHAAGPWPFPQLGAISTARGHHWIIENNVVRQVNGVGIDIGRQKLEDYDRVYGFHIVRGNWISDCGICGINGFGPGDGDTENGLLVENNLIERIGFHDAENLHECGGIKLHCCNRCLIRRNLVIDTLRGPGIWIDAHNAYTRCCENVILKSSGRGGLFFEISFKPNLIDSNIIWSSTTCGILEADGHGQTFAHNFIGDCREGIELRGKQTDRIAAEDCGAHEVFNNVIVNCDVPVLEKSIIPSRIESNLTHCNTASLSVENLELTWSAAGCAQLKCVDVPERTHDIYSRPIEPWSGQGPFGDVPAVRRTFELASIVQLGRIC